MNRLLSFFLTLITCLPLLAAQTDCAKRIASLIDPAKLATLGKRGGNQRIQKAAYWLAEAREAGRAVIAEGQAAGPWRKTFVYANNRLEGNAISTIAAMMQEG